MLVAVVILFGVCWLPIKTFMLLLVFWPNLIEITDSFTYYRYIGSFFFCHWFVNTYYTFWCYRLITYNKSLLDRPSTWKQIHLKIMRFLLPFGSFYSWVNNFYMSSTEMNGFCVIIVLMLFYGRMNAINFKVFSHLNHSNNYLWNV